MKMTPFQSVWAQILNFVPMTFGQKEFGNRKANRLRKQLRKKYGPPNPAGTKLAKAAFKKLLGKSHVGLNPDARSR